MRISKINIVPPVTPPVTPQIKLNDVPPLVPQEQNNISPNNFKGVFVPNTKEQPKFLYNKVMDVMHTFKIGGTIKNDGVDLPTATQKVKEKLKELGIKFNIIDNKK